MCGGGDVRELRREMSQAGRVLRQWIGRLQNKDPHDLMEIWEQRPAKCQRMVASLPLQVSGPGGLQLSMPRPLGQGSPPGDVPPGQDALGDEHRDLCRVYYGQGFA